MKTIFLTLIWFVCFCSFSQDYENGSVDFGVGAAISVGLQEEVGFDMRLQYQPSTKKSTYIAEYNRFFVKEFENTEVYNEFGITYNIRLMHWNALSITGGVGYIGNDYKILSRAEDTSSLFFSTGNFNHAAALKFRGLYDINPIQVFVEFNLKSFGKRYDTVILGLTYSLGI
ncbi:hypothetical protein [Flavivirga rizhaonensis]|uniref:Outer membrane protein beta-barrel domain-containing protein n=1 Tax=Flavivirga rizhaonensis TaxID=2559571 RepID=A0A4S1DTW2_9FLAO|nr:hypothetical protein [Flavivirga rizhaonensis]TGV01491.1 hypothetical protein EM932_15470 [Flavivirga rizhaonensis]